jgi:hypothetical protein
MVIVCRKRDQCTAALAMFAVILFGAAQPAAAKSARCFTTDDGSYACEFTPTARNGSFRISAPGKPTYILDISGPGVALGFVNLGQRNVSLPGRYLHSRSEPECWVNDSTQAKICAK